MRNVSIIKDKIDGTPFAVIVIDKAKTINVFGSKGQGETWAEWVNSSKMSFDDAINSLDISLIAEKPKPASSANTQELMKFMRPEEVLELQAEINKKSILEIIETKSIEEPEYSEDEEIPDFTPVPEWPITDVEIAAIDVSYKQNAVDYKAKAFIAEKNISSLMYEVKGYRAIWDQNISSWRCPEDTVNGGQFTNRMGRGCTTGMMRRLGQFLMSLDDRNAIQPKLPGIDEPRTALYRAGKLIDRRAEASREKFVGKVKNRAARRQQRANLNPRFTDLYGALSKDKPVLSRARTAAGLKIQRVGANMAQEGFREMEKGTRRRARRIKKTEEDKFPTGRLGKKLRDEGGIIPNSKLGGYIVSSMGEKSYVINFNEMVRNSPALKSFDTVYDKDGNLVPNPIKGYNFVTRKEALETIHNHQLGIRVSKNKTTPETMDFDLIEEEIENFAIGNESDWDELVSGGAESWMVGLEFVDYDELQEAISKFAPGSRHVAAQKHTQKLQSFDGLEKLNESDPRIAEFKKITSQITETPYLYSTAFGNRRTESLSFAARLPEYRQGYVEQPIGTKEGIGIIENENGDTVQRYSIATFKDSKLEEAVTQIDTYDDSGEYLFTAVYKLPSGGTIEDVKTDFYVVASKPSMSVAEIEKQKSIKNGEISQHFRVHGGKNPLTDRGGFINAIKHRGPAGHQVVDLDEMINIDDKIGIIGSDYGWTDIDDDPQFSEWLDKGWKFVTRDEWHEFETKFLEDTGVTRKDILLKNRGETELHGLGGDSKLLKRSYLSRWEDADVDPDGYVRAFSAKDLEHMRRTVDRVSLTHLNDPIWKKAIRRKEKDSGRDLYGSPIDSKESRINRIRQNLSNLIAAFDPLADEDVKNRRALRKAQKLENKKLKDEDKPVTAKDYFTDFFDKDGKLGIESLLSRSQTSRNNFTNDIRNRGDYQSAAPRNMELERFFSDVNQTAGKPTPSFEAVKEFVDKIFEENDIFGADPSILAGRNSNNLSNQLLQAIHEFARENDQFDYPSYPHISLTNFRIIEKTDGYGTRKVAIREHIGIIPYKISHKKDPNKSENGLFEIGIHTSEIDDLTDEEIKDIETGKTSFDSLRDRFSKGLSNPELRTTVEDGSHIYIHFDRAGEVLQVDGHEYPKIPYRGSRNEKIDIASGGVSGKITTPKAQKIRNENLIRANDDQINIWDSKIPGRKNKRNRQQFGKEPKKQGIIARFLSGEGRKISRERDAAEREQQGRMPKSTENIKERFFRRLGQIGNRMSGTPDPVDLILPPRREPENMRTRTLGPNGIWGNYYSGGRVLEGLHAFPLPPNQNASDWKSNTDNIARIANLSDSLTHMGGWRPSITQEDRDREAELIEIYNEWRADLNDDTQNNLPGSDSNFGHAIVAEDVSPNYNRIAIYDKRLEHYPPIAIIDGDTGTSHLLDKNGEHLMSIVETEDVNGRKIIVPIIGPAARKQFEERERIPGFIERVTGKFRKRKPKNINAQAIIPKRLEKRGVVRSKTGRSGISYPKRTTGDYIQQIGSLGDAQVLMLYNGAKDALNDLEKDFRKHLNLSNFDELLEDDILDHIEDLKKSGKGRLAGIRANNLHDLIVLMDAVDSMDMMLINDLKPSRRNSIISNAGINTGIDIKKTRTFLPYGPTRQTDSATEITPFPGSARTQRTPVNLFETAPPSQPRPPIAITGPGLIPGVGNPALNISFRNGYYIDENIGESIEDLSGLPVTADIIYSPHKLDENGSFPSIPLPGSIRGIKPMRVTKIAPGVDPNNPDVLQSDDPRRAIQIDSVIQTFDEAAQSVADAGMALDFLHPVEFGYMDNLTDIASNMGGIPTNRKEVWDAALQNSATLNGLYKTSSRIFSNDADMYVVQDYIDRSGVGPIGGVNRMYLPGTVSDDASQDLANMLQSVNRAMHAQSILDTLEYLTANPSLIRAWDMTWGAQGHKVGYRRSSPELDVTPANIELWRERKDSAWADAASKLVAIQQSNSLKSNNALDAIRDAGEQPQNINRQQLSLFIRHGQVAEAAEHLLRKHILSDPDVMDGLAAKKRQNMEAAARRANARLKNMANRAQSRRKNVGALDGVIDPTTGNYVLDIHGNGQVSNVAPRTTQEIMDIFREHRATGALERPEIDPLTGDVIEGILDDEDIEMLAKMGEAHTAFSNGDRLAAGHPDLVGTDFYDLGSMMMGSWWQYSGYSSYPLLLDEREIEALLSEVNNSGKPKAVAITRGIKDFNNVPAGDLIEQNLRGDRFVVGQGQSASGRGEYWTGRPEHWSSFHAPSRGSQIGIITSEHKIIPSKIADMLFTGPGGGQGDSLLYGALWAIGNAHGAPDFGAGVNTSHGSESIYGIPANSILPDPTTGLYDIQKLQDAVDKMTDRTPGQEGIATLEGWRRAGRMPSWLADSLFPEDRASFAADFPILGQGYYDQAKELRKEWNAWLSQHLSWFVQIAQMARDESQPGQAGIDAKAWNKKLNTARRTILYMSRENRLATMGFDAYVAGSQASSIHSLAHPYDLWNSPYNGLSTGAEDVIIILNRSAGMYYRMPTEWKAFRDRINRNRRLIPWSN